VSQIQRVKFIEPQGSIVYPRKDMKTTHNGFCAQDYELAYRCSRNQWQSQEDTSWRWTSSEQHLPLRLYTSFLHLCLKQWHEPHMDPVRSALLRSSYTYAFVRSPLLLLPMASGLPRNILSFGDVNQISLQLWTCRLTQRSRMFYLELFRHN